MPASRSLKRGDRVLTWDWEGLVLRALSPASATMGATIVREVAYTEPVKSDRTHKAQTRITFTDGTAVNYPTTADWIIAS